jgi:hypothetical protein
MYRMHFRTSFNTSMMHYRSSGQVNAPQYFILKAHAAEMPGTISRRHYTSLSTQTVRIAIQQL